MVNVICVLDGDDAGADVLGTVRVVSFFVRHVNELLKSHFVTSQTRRRTTTTTTTTTTATSTATTGLDRTDRLPMVLPLVPLPLPLQPLRYHGDRHSYRNARAWAREGIPKQSKTFALVVVLAAAAVGSMQFVSQESMYPWERLLLDAGIDGTWCCSCLRLRSRSCVSVDVFVFAYSIVFVESSQATCDGERLETREEIVGKV